MFLARCSWKSKRGLQQSTVFFVHKRRHWLLEAHPLEDMAEGKVDLEPQSFEGQVRSHYFQHSCTACMRVATATCSGEGLEPSSCLRHKECYSAESFTHRFTQVQIYFNTQAFIYIHIYILLIYIHSCACSHTSRLLGRYTVSPTLTW